MRNRAYVRVTLLRVSRRELAPPEAVDPHLDLRLEDGSGLDVMEVLLEENRINHANKEESKLVSSQITIPYGPIFLP